MQAVMIAALAAASLGVDVGWQPAPEGGLEYIIQISPEQLQQMQAGQELAVGIRPELRDVRRYRIVVGKAPLPREGLPRETLPEQPAAFEPNGAAPLHAATSAGGTIAANDFSDAPPTVAHSARPDLLAQAGTSGADPRGSRYDTYLDSVTPPTTATAQPVQNTVAYDWFSEQFGGAGSVSVPLLYLPDENAGGSGSTSTNPSADGWSSANPNPSTTPNNEAGGLTPVITNPNPGTANPGSQVQNPNSQYVDPRYSNPQYPQYPQYTAGNELNPPQDAGSTFTPNPNYGNRQPTTGQPTGPPNPYANGYTGYPGTTTNPYVTGQYPQANPYVQQPAGPQFASNTGIQAGTSGAAVTTGAQDSTPEKKDPQEKPWGFLMMAVMALFASVGLNMYLGWNFYDARLRYLDLLDSLRRRGPGREPLGEF